MIGILIDLIFRAVTAGALDMGGLVLMRDLFDIAVTGSAEPCAVDRGLVPGRIDRVMTSQAILILDGFARKSVSG